ncbi:MAG: hypothetical protein IKR11_01930 [Solobacterium sp.]|nr:hypothetical protein [Solobacterium sp.]
MNEMLRKLKHSCGETLAETMIALLIGALAMLLLASMINSSSRVIFRSKEKIQDYTEAENKLIRSPEAERKKGTLTLFDESGQTVKLTEKADVSVKVSYSSYEVIAKKEVYAYEADLSGE